ncbi:methylenetetrahydrofolate reductase [Actibacterium pelagium]|uniref:Methylenetetrahydrofolate reductase n=1 Tax=Actibacterium pelagium TaxID=2029103 RepID=A0A917ACX3_9RHOB|nr:5,10-methylenetetrahydrofolate reductase [Actibacterium pelagium]GGE43018.1 methylenetetrahydrofolate reductase [Actibacterium pelagium]
MSVFPIDANKKPNASASGLMQRFSIEVMPRTAAKVESFRAILPKGTRVYVAHIEGTMIDDMIATAKRLTDEGFVAMPHIPARIVPDRARLKTWLKRYRDEAGVSQALVLAGSPKAPLGDFHSAIQLLETGLFDQLGFNRLHVAGHPEGNKDIDTRGGTRLVDDAAKWKSDFANRTDAKMAMVTQFAFDADPVLNWARRMQAAGVDLPIHVGVAGPTKLNTLIKFAIACGVGPSLKVLKKRALDLTKLAAPFEPTDVINAVSEGHAAGQAGLIESIHLFPLGGIKASANYATAFGNDAGHQRAMG